LAIKDVQNTQASSLAFMKSSLYNLLFFHTFGFLKLT